MSDSEPTSYEDVGHHGPLGMLLVDFLSLGRKNPVIDFSCRVIGSQPRALLVVRGARHLQNLLVRYHLQRSNPDLGLNGNKLRQMETMKDKFPLL